MLRSLPFKPSSHTFWMHLLVESFPSRGGKRREKLQILGRRLFQKYNRDKEFAMEMEQARWIVVEYSPRKSPVCDHEDPEGSQGPTQVPEIIRNDECVPEVPEQLKEKNTSMERHSESSSMGIVKVALKDSHWPLHPSQSTSVLKSISEVRAADNVSQEVDVHPEGNSKESSTRSVNFGLKHGPVDSGHRFC